MAKTNVPVFAQTPKTATAVVTTAAVVTSDAPTNTVLLLTAGTEGGIVSSLQAIPRDTNTDLNLMIFLSNSASPAIKRIIGSKLLAANSASAVKAFPLVDFGYTEDNPLRLAAGDQLLVATSVALANGIVFMAEYMEF